MTAQKKASATARFFRSAADFRDWLDRFGEERVDLVVGFYKKHSGKGGLTYAEAVDEALCFGWIDGIVRRIDDEAYSHRFTPRTATSTWSQVNLRRVKELAALGRMAAPGIAAWERRKESAKPVYSHEQTENPVLGAAYTRRFKANAKAWTWFTTRRPSYQRAATLWVIGAKQEATRERRFLQLLEYSAKEEAVPPFIERRPKAANET